MTGKYNTEHKNLKYLVEFKHYSVEEAKKKKISKIDKPLSDEIEQFNSYASDILKTFPDNIITKFVIYTVGSQFYRFFKIS